MSATRIRPGAPFHLASLTKMYTAALVLRLVAHRRLDLTDSITAHLPAQLTERLTGSWAFHSPEDGLYLAGTFEDPSAVAAPFRFIPALIRAHAD